MLNSLPNDEIFADDKFYIAKMTIFVLVMVENIVGKGENAGNQHFLLFPQCFLKGTLKVVIVWERVDKRLALKFLWHL